MAWNTFFHLKPAMANPTNKPRIQYQFIHRLASLLVVLVIAAIVGMAVVENTQGYFEHLHRGEINSANLARAAAQHADDAIKELDAFSAGMVERVQHDGIAGANKERLRKIFKNQRAVMRQIHGVFVYDQNGDWLLTDKDNYPANLNNADREYFAWHRQHPDDTGMHLGPAVRSRSTGDWVIPLSRRLNNPDGSFAGVFLVTIFVEYFNDFYAGFHLDHNGIFVVALRDGTVLARRPFNEQVIGSSLAKGEIYTKYLPYAPIGTARVTSIVDGVERINSYRQLERYSLVVQAGLSVESILKPWREEVFRSALFVLAIVSVILFLSCALLRQLRFGISIEQELRETQAVLERLAMEDALTGLPNRRQLDALLYRETARARRQRTAVAVLMMDIDHFKKYNDHYGHQAGDLCLRDVAQAIASCLKRPADAAFRYGGEEFVALLPDTDLDGACQMAATIRTAVAGLAIAHAGSDVGRVTLSIGVAAVMPITDNAGSLLLRSADEALYQAKRAGRNQAYPPLTVVG